MAMIGGSAFCGAVTHTLSSAIVLLEMTGDVTFCVHSMLATSVAISLSRVMTESIFDKIIRLRGLPFLFALRYSPKPVYARDFMSRSIVPSLCFLQRSYFCVCLLCFDCCFVCFIVPEITTFGFIKSILESDSYKNIFVFPVVDSSSLLFI